MGYGKSKESANQERSNLLGINPIANRASGGSFMSKHSSSQGMPRLGSPLHQGGLLDKVKGLVQSGYESLQRNTTGTIDTSASGSLQSQRSGTTKFGLPETTRQKREKSITAASNLSKKNKSDSIRKSDSDIYKKYNEQMDLVKDNDISHITHPSDNPNYSRNSLKKTKKTKKGV